MNFKEIETLLDKFYSGESTPEEERQLREFFSREAVPPYLSEHAGLFRYYDEARTEELLDPEFENRFLAAIKEPPGIKLNSGRNQRIYITGIAAAVFLLAGLFFTFRNDIMQRSLKNSPETAIAYHQAKDALALLSANFNSGLDQTQQLENFQKGMDQVQKLKAFQKGIDEINKFSIFYQYQYIIINQGDQPRP
jgi:hypothetical protein